MNKRLQRKVTVDMRTDKSTRRYTVAEFFCGCGGFSRGFAMTGKFNVIFGNDIKEAALITFRENHTSELGKPEIIQKDLRKVGIDEILSALEKKGVTKGKLDCLIGGPPCQGFSQVRRSVDREDGEIVGFGGYDKSLEDPRNGLIFKFLEIAQQLQPRFVVIENVPQMLTHTFNGVKGGLVDSIRQVLENRMRYKTKVEILDAANYGVPQTRERLFIMASRDGVASFPEPTHENNESANSSNAHWVTVEEAIGDLPSPSLRKEKLGGKSIACYKSNPSDYASQLRSSNCFPYNHIRRNYGKSVRAIIEKMQPGETWDAASKRMKEGYAKLIEAYRKPNESTEKVFNRLVTEELINPVFYKEYYWSAYTRLAPESPALTITANANYLGSGRYTHPTENRGLTMREAARLQSFDDDFRFITSGDDKSDTKNIRVGMDMIGEAVPPLLAKAIATHIIKLIEDEESIANQSLEHQTSDLISL